MNKVISYSIFGHGDKNESSFDFRSYARGLEINLRVAEVLYPDWDVEWVVDEQTYDSEYINYFNFHYDRMNITVMPKAALCEMMLWRMLPAFDKGVERFICRDCDSLLSRRERQAVAYWQGTGKVAHAITDSVSHNISLMGGMIGFRNGYLKERLGVKTFEQMLALHPMPFDKKGSDQEFLNRVVLPNVHDSITEHYVLGMPQSFRGDCFNYIQDIDVGPDYLKELNGLAFHIGASGYQETGVLKWLSKYGKNNDMYNEIEKQYSSTFYWQL